jgi:glucose-6-phosphate 1-dehydrogenase
MNSKDAPPSVIVIFGVTGDLSRKKLLPAMSQLAQDGALHAATKIVGVSRTATTFDSPGSAPQDLSGRLQMFTMDVTHESEYDRLGALLDEMDTAAGRPLQRLYYLSLPPMVALPIVRFLGLSGLNKPQKGAQKPHLLMEKPFGYDQASARELIDETALYFSEDQLFRIDHFLAKETVQNILTFRRHNPIFGAVWSAEYIERIEVVAFETKDIEGRANFYEQTGALRDLIQSHLLQILALVTMELPEDLTNDQIHASKETLLQQIAAIMPNEVAGKSTRGQYAGYKNEVDNPRSIIETYADITVAINNNRWEGVEVVVATGKSLSEKSTRVDVFFKAAKGRASSILTFRLQPDEGIELDLLVKKPGFDNELQSADMEFSYTEHLKADRQPEAYERVLVDAMRGDHTLFATSAEVLESWRIIDSVLHQWAKDDNGLKQYDKGARPILT